MSEKDPIRLSKHEFEQVKASLLSGSDWIGVHGALFNAKSISALSADSFAEHEQNAGRLHDGSQVVRKYGRWVDARDENVVIDPTYYPELAKDQVLDESTWKAQVAPLNSTQERKTRFLELFDTVLAPLRLAGQDS